MPGDLTKLKMNRHVIQVNRMTMSLGHTLTVSFGNGSPRISISQRNNIRMLL